MSNVDEILAERGSRYGVFSGNAAIAQALKDVMRSSGNWETDAMDDDQKEALEMIAHKIARILNGSANYADNWVDISGYAQLIVKRLEGYAI